MSIRDHVRQTENSRARRFSEMFRAKPRFLAQAIISGWTDEEALEAFKVAPDEGPAHRLSDVLNSILAECEAARKDRT